MFCTTLSDAIGRSVCVDDVIQQIRESASALDFDWITLPNCESEAISELLKTRYEYDGWNLRKERITSIKQQK